MNAKGEDIGESGLQRPDIADGCSVELNDQLCLSQGQSNDHFVEGFRGRWLSRADLTATGGRLGNGAGQIVLRQLKAARPYEEDEEQKNDIDHGSHLQLE